MPHLFGSADRMDEAPAVTAVRPLAGGKRWSVIVGRKRVATLDRLSLESLGVRVGVAWTGELAAAAAQQQRTDAARLAAVRLLAARSRTRKELVDRLAARGFEQGIVAAIADGLQKQGMLNDLETARSDVRSRSRGRQREARALTVARLAARGVPPSVAERALAAELPPENDRAAAAALALERAKAMDPRLDGDVVRRRVFAHLARRGFDDETCEEAADRALRRLGLRSTRAGASGE